MKLTQGAYGFLCRRYRNILVKCGMAAMCALTFSAPALAAEGTDDLPAPGSSFTVDRVMVFKNQDISYGNIKGPNDASDFLLELDHSKISAKEVDLAHLPVLSTDSSFKSSTGMTIFKATLENSSFTSSGNMAFNNPVNVTGGESILESGKDLGLMYGTVLSDGAALSLVAGLEIMGSGLDATNIATEHLTIQGGMNLRDGEFISKNEKFPSMIMDSMTLENMQSKIGEIHVLGKTEVSGGKFDVRQATFLNTASFEDVDMEISALSAKDFAVDGGSLRLGVEGNDKSSISGNLDLESAASTIGNLEVKGATTVTGGSLQAHTLALGETVFDNVQPQIGNLTLTGPLTLQNSAKLDASPDVIGSNQVTINSGSRLNIDGSFATEKLYMDQGTLSASGDVNVSMNDFALKSGRIIGDSITVQDMSSSGQSSLEAGTAIKAGNVNVLSGRTVFQAASDPGTVDIDTLQLRGGAVASLQGSVNTVGSIQGQGSLNAHNLQVSNDLSLSGGSLQLSGENTVGNDLTLEAVNASVNNLTVKGNAQITASSVTGKNVSLENGATLDNQSMVEVQALKSGGDIRLSGNSEILAGEMDLGGGHLVLDGSGGQSAIVAVGEFGGGNLTVEANSLLSIGTDTSGWASMVMGAHNVSAALGLWTPFELGAGSYAAVGAGTLARNNGSPRANQIGFSADSLLITNAAVASKDGKGAISSAAPSVANVEAGAKLHILHAQKDGLYRVLGENITVNYDGNAWQGDNVKTDSALIKLERLGGDKLGWFQAKAPGASTVLPGLDPDIGGSVDDAGNKGQIPPEPDSVPKPPSSNPITPPAQPNPPQPDTPVQPDNPSTPGTPEQPDTPSTPDNPGQPDNPTTPDNPEQPGNPSQPDTPDQPEPDQPGTDEPDEPDTPDEPENPDNLPQLKYDYTPGQLFLSRATNLWFIGHDARLAARTIESAARIFALGAVPEMTFAANQAGSAAMSQRTGADCNSGIQAMNTEGEIIENGKNRHGFALWISPLYKSVNGYSLTSGHWDVDINGALGGVAIGADYTFENALRLGLSFNIGGGYSQSGGELAETTNNMSFWGLGAYAGWSKNNFDVSADVAFTSTYNKIKQDLPQAMLMDDLKSDITARALSAGIELGYTFQTAFADIRPHAGARYTHIYNDAYDVNSGGTVLEGKARSQNVWTFPVGVSLEKQFEFDNGWHLRPMLDFSVIPAAGDRKAWSEARFTGTDTWATMKDQFMDDISYRGSIGLEFDAGNLSLGLNYSMQAGMKTNSQTVMGTFAYTF